MVVEDFGQPLNDLRSLLFRRAQKVGQSTLKISSTDRVIFLVETPPSVRDVERFGVELLSRAGLSAEFWDLSALLLPKSRKQWIRGANHVVVRTYRERGEVEKDLRNLGSSDLLVILVGTDGSQ